MRKVLAGPEPVHLADSLVTSASGLCRTTSGVRSDLDEFIDLVESARVADTRSESDSLIAHARQLMRIYSADLLPGDLYDDWMDEVRNRARLDFCDALTRAALAAEGCGRYSDALELLSRVLTVDPWREDVYQATMRCHARAGQRSLAIQTYMHCRSRLVEDLGIDPSAETKQVYEALLTLDSR
jgi:DNA-binding SARP family transcriptional activator